MFTDNFFKNPSYPKEDKKIHYYNDYDQDIYILLSDWIKFILPNEIKRVSNCGYSLFKLVLFCYNNGISIHVVNEVPRMIKFEPSNVDFCLLAINTYIACDMFDDALKLLTFSLNKHPKNGLLLTCLSKLHYKLGKNELCLKYLWEGLMLEPNQEDALFSYCNILSQDNLDLCIERLNILANKEGSFIPSLILANIMLIQNDLVRAFNIYSKLLKSFSNNTYILTTIAKTLGRFGYYSELISLIEPIYIFDKMPHIIGLELLNAYAFCKLYTKGEVLLHKFMQLNNPCYLDYLLNISNLLDMFKPSSKNTISEANCKHTITVFDTPIWYYSLGNPLWLLNNEPKLSKIGILPFINFSNSNIYSSNIYYEDNTSRLARSLPLYIGERIHYETNFDFNYLLPIAIPKGPFIKKSTYSEKYLHELAKKNNTPILIFGTINKKRKKYLFNINLYDATNRKFRVFPFSANPNTFGKNINSMIEETFSSIVGLKLKKSDIYTTPPNSELYNYLQLLSHSLTQTLISNKLLNVTSLLGERNIINSYFNYALNNNDNISKLLLLSGLLKSKTYNKNIYLEPKNKIMKFFSQNNTVLGNDILPILNNLYNITTNVAKPLSLERGL